MTWEYTIAALDTTDVCRLHKYVMGGFDRELPNPARHSGQILWTLLPGMDELLVRSGVRANPGAWDDAVGDEVQFPVTDSERYRFTAVVNPVKRRIVRIADERTGKIDVPCDAFEWLAGKEGCCGFAVEKPDVRILDERLVRGNDGQKNVTFRLATVTGVLSVKDSNKLITTWMTGIGRGKAYGAGLLHLEAT